MRGVWLNRIVLILSLAGIVAAATLTYAKLQNLIIPCGVAGTGCVDVANHPSSVWFGIPVSVYGLALYVAILGLSIFRMVKGLENTRGVGLLSYWMSLAGAITSIGLQMYSITVIKAVCTWCMASAVIMVLIFIFQAALYQALSGEPKAEPEPKPAADRARRKGDFAVLAVATLLAMGALFGAQHMTKGASPTKKYVIPKANLAALVPDEVQIKGAKDAPITIVEFGDLCCPGCARAYMLLKELEKKHEGKIRIVFRHFPLFNMHPESFRASVYAEFASKTGKFWDFLDRAYQNDPEAVNSQQTWDTLAESLNLDLKEAQRQYADDKSWAFQRVWRDFKAANDFDVKVTPTFFMYAEDEDPYYIPISDISRKLEATEKYRKLLGLDG